MEESELRSELERLHTDAFGWALHCCRYRREIAEDVLQSVYLNILEGRARFDGRSAFRTWLLAVIRRAAAAERRTSWLRGRLIARNGDLLRPEPQAADDGVERADRAGRLQRSLVRLPRRQREVLHLVFYQDFTVEEAAAVMSVSVGSARVHYARGKARLAQLLAGSDGP